MTTHALSHRAVRSRRSHWKAAALADFAAEHFVLLPVGAAIALIWANLAPESYFPFAQRLLFPVNEIGMALFFALVTQEIVEATMPGGPLHTWRRWTLPLVGAAGGLVGSIGLYLAYVNLNYQTVLERGWPVAGAVDLAFAYFIVRSIFRRQAALPFVLLLAIGSVAFGLAAVGWLYPTMTVGAGGTALLLAAMALAYGLRRFKVHSFWPYLFLCGPLAWWALYLDGIHPALALVPIVPFLPHRARTLDIFADDPNARRDSPRHFEHEWNYAVQIVLFLFALVNAGVLMKGYGAGTWGIAAAALVGRPLGILGAVGLAVAFGLHLPARLHVRDLIVVAIAASTGFTFALFFATGVYPIGPLLAEAKIGALLSVAGLPLALGAGWLLGVGRFSGRPGAHASKRHDHPPR